MNIPPIYGGVFRRRERFRGERAGPKRPRALRRMDGGRQAGNQWAQRPCAESIPDPDTWSAQILSTPLVTLCGTERTGCPTGSKQRLQRSMIPRDFRFAGFGKQLSLQLQAHLCPLGVNQPHSRAPPYRDSSWREDRHEPPPPHHDSEQKSGPLWV